MSVRKRREKQTETVANSTNPGASRALRTVGFVSGLVLITLLAYSNSFDGKFVFDDQAGIIDNELIRRIAPIERFFNSSQPLTDISFALNFASGGLSPYGFHVVNLCIHVVAGLFLFGIVRRIARLPQFAEWWSKRSDSLAFSVSCLWLVHPLQTESVTYIVQRSEAMMGCFYLLAVYAALRAWGAARPLYWSVASVLAIAASMASKSVAVTAPVVILLFDRAFLFDCFREAFKARWKLYLGLLATYSVPLALGVFHGLIFESPETATVGFGFKGISPMEYLQTQPGVLLHYLGLVVWPVGQCLDYGWPIARSAQEIVIPAIIVGAICLAGIVGTIRRLPSGFLLISPLLILLPTSSFVPLKDLAFEHRMYLPLAPILAAIVSFLMIMLDRLGQSSGAIRSKGPVVLALLLSLGLISLAFVTRVRNSLYEDPGRMWADVVAKAPNNPRPHNALGFVDLTEGRFDDAIERFKEATRRDADYAPAYANLGKAYYKKRDMESAVREFRIAEHLSPAAVSAESHLMFGNALVETSRTADAIEEFKIAISKDPRLDTAYYNLADVLWKQGRRESAAAVYQQALAVSPGMVEARINLGLVLSELDRHDEAIVSLEGAVRAIGQGTRPETVIRSYYNLGFELFRVGRKQEAAVYLRRVLKLNPSHESANKLLKALEPTDGQAS